MSGAASERDSDALHLFPAEIRAARAVDGPIWQGAANDSATVLGNIGHEIQIPLNGLLGIAGLLKATGLDATQSGYVEAIERSTEALLGVLSNLLEYAELESGVTLPQTGPVQIEQLMAAAIATFQAVAEAKSIELRLDLGEGSVSTRTCDQVMVLRILSQLLNNAVKFTQGGSVVLCAQRVGQEEDGLMRFTVADTGIGMTAETLQAVLKGVPSAHSPHGAGIGLLIAHSLVWQMGGRLWATSEAGKGSRFSVEIPMGPNLAVNDAEISHTTQHLKGARVLVVEDDSVDGMLLSAPLARSGADVTTLSSGSQLAAVMSEHQFDAVLLDLQLPALDGIRATRAIRDMDGYGRSTPIIGFTTDLSELDRWACTQSGMTDFVIKPPIAEKLISLLMKCLRQPVSLGRPA